MGKYVVEFKYAVGQRITFYCGKENFLGDIFKGTITEQSNYLDKGDMKTTIVGYTIQSGGQTYYHITEKNVFPKSVDPGIVLKIMQYRSVSNEYLRIIAKEDLLKKKLDELLADIPEDIDIEV